MPTHLWRLPALFLLLLIQPLFAATGDLDMSYRPRVYSNVQWGSVSALAVVENGSALVGSSVAVAPSIPGPWLKTISSSAQTTASGTTTAAYNGLVLRQWDGKTLIAGAAVDSSSNSDGIVRLNADGSKDTSFLASIAKGSVRAAVLQDDGKIVIGGSFSSVNGLSKAGLARLNANGTLDMSFNPTVDGTVLALKIQPDGKILLGGLFSQVNGENRHGLARLTETGFTDWGFVSAAGFAEPYSSVRCIVTHPNGDLFVAGSFEKKLVHLGPNGGFKKVLSLPGTNPEVHAMVLQADGKLIIGGRFGKENHTVFDQHRLVLRLLSDGTLDPSFRSPFNLGYPLGIGPDVNALALQEDGRILLGMRGGLSYSSFGEVMARLTPLLSRLENEPSTSLLHLADATTVEWLRGGTAPEVSEVRFESSQDGSVWHDLGQGSRIAGGWRLAGTALPVGGYVRACGRTSSGYLAASSGLVSKVISIAQGAPKIELVGPDGTAVSDDSGVFNFGNTYEPKTFKIRNAGTGNLVIEDLVFRNLDYCFIEAKIDGLKRPLAPNEESTFSVFVDPVNYQAGENVSATLIVSSNDDENAELSFSLMGNMALSPVAEIETFAFYLRATPSSRQYWAPRLISTPGANTFTVPVNADTVAAGIEIYSPRHVGETFKFRINGVEKVFHSRFIDFEFTGLTSPVVLDFCSPDGTTWKTYTLVPQRAQPTEGSVDLTYLRDEVVNWGTPQALDGKKRVLTSSERLTALGDKDESFSKALERKVTHVLSDGAVLSTDGTAVYFHEADGVQKWIYTASGAVQSLSYLSDGSVLLGGTFNKPGGEVVGLLKIIRGMEDKSYVSPVLGSVYTHMITAENKILVGGKFRLRGNQSAEVSLARFLISGMLDESFIVTGSNAPVKGMLALKTGDTLVYGDFSSYDSQPAKAIVKIKANGEVNRSFALGGNVTSVTSAVVNAGAGITLTVKYSNQPSADTWVLSIDASGHNRLVYATPILSGPGENVGLLIQENGSVLVGGDIQKVNNIAASSIVRIHGSDTVNILGFYSSENSITLDWSLIGGSPQPLKSWFEYSTDNGVSWQWLGSGLLIHDAPLPSKGLLRARALVQSGPYSKSLGLIESVREFSFEPPVLFPRWSLAGSDNQDLGQIPLGRAVSGELFIRNDGDTALKGVKVKLSGSGAGNFQLTERPEAVMAPGTNQAQALRYRFAPSKLGPVSVTVTVSVADGSVSPLTFTLNATVIAGKKAKATTLVSQPAPLDRSGQVLMGVLETNTMQDEEMFFEYGLNKNEVAKGFGKRISASPYLDEGSANVTVTAQLSGLKSRTRYYYRVCLLSVQGSAEGAVRSFMIGNLAPSGMGDVIDIIPGSTMALNVLANDSDPEGDKLSVASVTAVEPAAAGSVALVKNTVQFKSGDTPGECSFTYRVKDAYGAVSEPVSVRITPDTEASLTPEKTVAAAGEVYDLALTTAAHWTVKNPLKWVTVDADSGHGSRALKIVVSANTKKESREGTLFVGSLAHVVTQDGIERPVLQAPAAPVPQAFITAPYSLQIPTTGLPVTYTVKNLPPGLTLSGTTGLISGVPTRAGVFSVIIMAKNDAGSAEPISFELEVVALRPEFVGRHEGILDIDSQGPAVLGGRYEMTVTSSGSLSGKLTCAGKAEAFKGQLRVSAQQPGWALITIPLPTTRGGPERVLEVRLDSDHAGVNYIRVMHNQVEAAFGQGWWIPWNGKDRLATAFAETYSFVLPAADTVLDLPRGHGFASLTVAEKTGAAKISGRLADGSSFTCSSSLGWHGNFVLYQSLYQNSGVVQGPMLVSSAAQVQNNTVGGEVKWLKLPAVPKPGNQLYTQGFGPLSLAADGGGRPRLSPGGLIMNVSAGDEPQMRLELSEGGLAETLVADLVVSNPSAKGTTNKVEQVAGALAVKVSVNTKTGMLTGDFSLSGGAVKIPFSGLLVPTESGVRGLGYFLVRHASGDAGQTGMILKSGAVLFRPLLPP